MPLPHVVIPTVARLDVRLTGGPVVHPTAGYRLWRGQFECAEPIVAIAMTVSGGRACWTRTSHRGTPTLETSILFSPFDEKGHRIGVSFSVLDAVTVSQTCVDSIQTQPAPLPQSFSTGELVHIATITTEPMCELKAMFLARRDVASVRNGAWHARAAHVASIGEPWHAILTYGRTGVFDAAQPAASVEHAGG